MTKRRRKGDMPNRADRARMAARELQKAHNLARSLSQDALPDECCYRCSKADAQAGVIVAGSRDALISVVSDLTDFPRAATEFTYDEDPGEDGQWYVILCAECMATKGIPRKIQFHRHEWEEAKAARARGDYPDPVRGINADALEGGRWR
jgi:hypothetical protein